MLVLSGRVRHFSCIMGEARYKDNFAPLDGKTSLWAVMLHSSARNAKAEVGGVRWIKQFTTQRVVILLFFVFFKIAFQPSTVFF